MVAIRNKKSDREVPSDRSYSANTDINPRSRERLNKAQGAYLAQNYFDIVRSDRPVQVVHRMRWTDVFDF